MFAEMLKRRRERKAATFNAVENADRRNFVKGFGVAAAGAAAATAFGAAPSRAQMADLDVPILEFALNLEYLEAEFYNIAAYGQRLTPFNTGKSGGVTGGSKVAFRSTYLEAYAQEIADEERKHVEFLRAALGSSAPSEPAINLSTSFSTLGEIAGLGSGFNPFADEFSFMLGAYVFEDVGVTAYHGAAQLITSKAYLDKAAGILATEAYHAGIIRTVLFANNYSNQTQAISNVRVTLDGTSASAETIDDAGVGNTAYPRLALVSNALNGGLTGGSSANAPGNNAIAFDRTTNQVLNIVYGGGQGKGLFYPNGMNGTITAQS